MQTATLSEARKLGLKFYSPTQPCKNGHLVQRRVITRACTECERAAVRKKFKSGYYSDWLEKNKDDQQKKSQIRGRSRYAKNRERIRENNNRWRLENMGVWASYKAKHRASKLSATPQWLSAIHLKEIKTIYKTAKDFCMEVDHIIPLQGKNVCGLHVPWNLQILTKSANASKHNKVVYG